MKYKVTVTCTVEVSADDELEACSEAINILNLEEIPDVANFTTIWPESIS